MTAKGDEQRKMIWKIIAYDNFYGMYLTVMRNPDEFAPSDFIFILPDDADKDIPVTLTVQKRGQITVQMQFALGESKAQILLVMPHTLE